MLRGSAMSIARLAKGSSRLAARNLSPNCVRTSTAFRPNFRFFSASSSASETSGTIVAAVSNAVPAAAPIDSTSVIDGISHIESASSELGFSPSHLVMQVVEQIHLMVGIPYWEAIVVATVALRIIMLPLAITSVQNAARMSTLRPAMQAVKDRQARHPNADDPSVRTIFEAETRQLFLSHKVNPLKSLAMPIIQLPIFISLYFGLRDMGIYFPGYCTGGEFWFTDLTAADPYFIFPLVNALSFLVMIELGSDGIQTENQGMFKWGMRGLAVAIGPLTYATPQGVFLYWSTNNVVSIFQSLVLKQDRFRVYFDIPKMPKPEETPVFKMVNPFKSVMDVVKKETFTNTSNEVEIVDRPPVPALKTPVGPPPVTFAAPPRKSKKIKK